MNYISFWQNHIDSGCSFSVLWFIVCMYCHSNDRSITTWHGSRAHMHAASTQSSLLLMQLLSIKRKVAHYDPSMFIMVSSFIVVEPTG